jgi:dTDP-4-amino-4,6-dideoxygalactose transaminase
LAPPSSTRTVPLLDLKAQHGPIREAVLRAIEGVADAQRFILGAEVEKFEEEVAAYCRTRFAVGCASGSDALLLALLALNVGPGDEVLTVPYTFFATAGEIVHAGAKPVFVDVDAATFNIDVTQAAEMLKRNPRIRAILPVHLFGQCADMDPLLEMACARGIPVIEDAAQAIGAEYRGRAAGSMGEIACFSFFPSKNLGAYGDGGMVTTNDPELRKKLAALRVHGSVEKYYHEWVGLNSRLDALQAAVLRVKLPHLDGWTAARRRNAGLYRKLLAEREVPVALPVEAPFNTRHIYNQFVICGARRDELCGYLRENGIGSEVYYPLPLHLQKCFAELGYRAGDFPVSERLAKESLALPVYAELTPEDIEYVAAHIQAFYARG